MTSRKQLEEKVRNVISVTVQEICDSALHLSITTGEKDWVKCCKEMDPDVFQKWTNITLALWLALVSKQDQSWRDLIQMQFDHNLVKQTNLAADIILKR